MIVTNVILSILLIAAVWLVAIIVLLLLIYGREIKRLWSEPLLRYPVVIFESDDWGVGPQTQVEALSALLKLFSQYRDSDGHYPVMTLGLILAEPDFHRMRTQKCQKNGNVDYFKKDLSAPEYTNLLDVINAGQKDHIFTLQLHGMEHFWPDSLMASQNQPDVSEWLYQTESPVTENLPSFLQSRWCDTSKLPSKAHDNNKILSAIEHEITLFKTLFRQMPMVVVPPTFVWTNDVVQAYTDNNVNIFVTPGRQYTGRDAEGKLLPDNRTFYNGDADKNSAALYIVRDMYFEPALGHKAEDVLMQIITQTQYGRPALLEIHRFNFLSEKMHSDQHQSMHELKKLLDLLHSKLTQLKFVSTEELAEILKSKDNKWLLNSSLACFRLRLKRIQLFFYNNRIAKYSGFNLFLFLILQLYKGNLITNGQ